MRSVRQSPFSLAVHKDRILSIALLIGKRYAPVQQIALGASGEAGLNPKQEGDEGFFIVDAKAPSSWGP